MEAVRAISAQPPLKDIATLAQEIAVDAGDQGLSYREILLRAEGRGYAPFILFAAVLLLAPIDVVLHQVAAATLLVCGMGVFFRKPAPWMPKFLANQKAKRDDLDGLVTALKGVQSFTHLVVSPRHPEFSFGVGEKAAGLSLI